MVGEPDAWQDCRTAMTGSLQALRFQLTLCRWTPAASQLQYMAALCLNVLVTARDFAFVVPQGQRLAVTDGTSAQLEKLVGQRCVASGPAAKCGRRRRVHNGAPAHPSVPVLLQIPAV